MPENKFTCCYIPVLRMHRCIARREYVMSERYSYYRVIKVLKNDINNNEHFRRNANRTDVEHRRIFKTARFSNPNVLGLLQLALFFVFLPWIGIGITGGKILNFFIITFVHRFSIYNLEYLFMIRC